MQKQGDKNNNTYHIVWHKKSKHPQFGKMLAGKLVKRQDLSFHKDKMNQLKESCSEQKPDK